MLVDLKYDTIKAIFGKIDVSFCDLRLCYKALTELIIRQNSTNVGFVVHKFKPFLHRDVPFTDHLTDTDVASILRSDHDYYIDVFIENYSIFNYSNVI